ncbi:MAG: di-heme enzyme [Ferruginibacter sp.]|nr:di-heme enzyme [Ferruginibacter sp.]
MTKVTKNIKWIIVGIPILLFFLFFSCTYNEDKKNETATSNNDSVLIQLGRYLFYDRRLSVNETKACATCHAQSFSFTDSYTRSIGALGDLHQRNAKPLINLLPNTYFTAADSSITSLEQQMNNPMFNQHPVEMGMMGNEETILAKFKKDNLYKKLFRAAFPTQSNPVSIANIKTAIAQFEKTIVSTNAPFDEYKRGDSTALTKEQLQGMNLFFSSTLKCGNCHGGDFFATPILKQADGKTDFYYNIGLYNLNDNYPAYDQGLFEKTNNEHDKGKYKVPTLRNLAFTAPYFHDGSAATLEDVISVYQQGGRLTTTGIYKGDGKTNKYKSNLITGFSLTLQQQKSLISFLFSLSDSSVLTNSDYANPFKDDETTH